MGGLGIWSGSGVVARGDRLVKGGFLFVEQQETKISDILLSKGVA